MAAFRSLPSFAAVLVVVATLFLVAARASAATAEYLNVYGETLQPCSYDGMALTGYTRSGYCVDRSDDSGSHHICIDLSSLGGDGSSNTNTNDYYDDDQNQNQNGNNDNKNFCDVTGQSDWCSAEDMPCHEDPDSNGCPVTNWCVCQWAFASYIQGTSGGCSNIQSVVCDSINQQALMAYQKMTSQSNNSDNNKYQDALDCLVERCGLDASQLAATAASSSSLFYGSNRFASGIAGRVATFLVVTSAILVVAAYLYRKRVMVVPSKTIQLNKDDDILAVAIGNNGVPLNSGSRLL